MKKLALTGVAVFAFAVGALAQGAINMDNSAANNGVADLTAGNYYGGPYGLQLWELNPLPTGSALTTLLAGINTASSGSAALALLTTDGFTMENEWDNQTMPAGGIIKLGVYSMADVPAGASCVLGLAVWNTSTTLATALTATGTHLGVIAFPEQTVNLVGPPPGIPFDLSGINQAAGFGWNSVGQDLVMTTVIPEPGTLTLAGLGVAALLIFRRRK
jgi:hypothetical protein